MGRKVSFSFFIPLALAEAVVRSDAIPLMSVVLSCSYALLSEETKQDEKEREVVGAFIAQHER